jgi:hypothetical protein
MSANKTVTTRRPSVVATASECPHAGQKRAPSGTGRAQDGHAINTRAYGTKDAATTSVSMIVR